MDNLWHLQGEDFFTGLERERELFLQRATKLRLQKNDIIFNEADPGESCFYIASGLVRIFSMHGSGKEPVFFLRRAGEFFGISEVLEGYPRKANAQSLTPAVLYRIGRKDFDALLRESYPLARRVISLLGCRIRHLGDTIRDLMACNVEDRLANVLITLAFDMLPDAESWQREIQLPMRVSQEHLAQLAGTTQPTVSELLKKFQRLGLIRVEHRRITLLSPQALLDRR
ncbi:Crp/Fnr family transcriptional regulator [Desulfovibrio sp. ZJ369]|uniref:Crp/Fnr family transcriptional regulator n=1 Tax=Desulfovibrio sp. ZJ369 TaxID=2709793 RepID=UPI0013EB6FC4|nr:Crp/Fnr family transcriptional regulator [Desulfovibrio sp. ZJ369]